MKRLWLAGAMLFSAALPAAADVYATYNAGTPGEYPTLNRPYYIDFSSRFDGATDLLMLAFPNDFDPNQSYPVWFKFMPYGGNIAHINDPTFATNYCDARDVIYVGCATRHTATAGAAWLGDNETLSADLRANIPADCIELMNQLCYLFKVPYVAATGASMGGYAALRFASLLPNNYFGAVVASCPALWTGIAPVGAGSNAIRAAVQNGHYSDRFVKLMHGDADASVPVTISRLLDSEAPDKTWWELVEVPGAGHEEFFYSAAGWGTSDVVPDMWAQIAFWEAAHPAMVNRTLAPLAGWTPPVEPAAWYLPEAVVLDKATKGIDQAVVRRKPPAALLYPQPARTGSSISFGLVIPEPSTPNPQPLTRIVIHDATGKLVRSIITPHPYPLPQGERGFEMLFEGKDDAGRPLPSGVYHYQVINGDGTPLAQGKIQLTK